jgi:hypothetical protein
MTENTADVQAKHNTFVKNIVATKTVYSLENEEGFATSYSNEYEHEDGEPVEIICFWSEKAYAEACAKDVWEGYTLAELPLEDFIENWCSGMYEDNLLVGTEFDSNMFGQETEPLELILQILNESEKTGVALEFEKYESTEELREIVKDLIGEF